MKISLLCCTLGLSASLHAIEGKWWNRPLIKDKGVVEEQTCSCELEECCCIEGTFTVGGEWIYLSPRTPDREFARVLQQSENITQGERKCFSWDFTSGGEVFAGYQQRSCEGCYAWDIRGSYTAYKNSDKSCVHTTGSEFIFPLVGFVPDSDTNHFAAAVASNCIDYQSATAEFGWTIFCDCPFTLRMFAGMEYANIKEKFSVNYQGSECELLNQVVMRPKMDGVGPRIGINGYWDVYCGFGVVAKFSTALLVSNLTGQMCQENRAERWKERYCCGTDLIPDLQAKLGLTWRTRCFDCFTVAVEGGYQAAYYFGPLQRLKVTNVGGMEEPIPLTMIRSENFGLDGYFINASISF
ncbi:MAG: hypothetical protein K940chlam2_01135 [Chlamydiae bacterium]|nr:hypothetical protein [Chlamydiota bacterium]